MPVCVRPSVGSLSEWDDLLLWYARAVKKMQERPGSDPTSWSYQAAIHGQSPGDPPSKYWNQCQHGTSFFLPWHRGYLGWFEQIVRAAVVGLGGPDTWALPYWNYSSPANPNAHILPPAFRAPTMPDGSENPLRVAQRNAKANEGKAIADATETSVKALDDGFFEGAAAGGSTGFGGPHVGFHHPPGRSGAVEQTPHNTIHMAVGGLMGGFATSPLDPIFWLHHANIDRLWEIWRQVKGHADPTDGGWLSFPFHIHDASGHPIEFTPAQMLDTTASPLLYEYDDLTDPRLEQPAHRGVGEPVAPERMGVNMVDETPSRPSVPPEMVGANDEQLHLSDQQSSTRLAISEPERPALAAEQAGAAPRVYLNLENVTSEAPSQSYGVYLNVPSDEDPREHPELLAGVLAPFGSERAADPDDAHGGSGLHYTFDITELIEGERERGAWDPKAVKVTFSPRGEAAGEPAQLDVGRVSVYYHG
jgi:tyrosinase